MPHFQVWIRGSDLAGVECETEKEAREFIRNFYGWKRLPKGTTVNTIPPGYYEEMVGFSRRAGFDASND